MSAPPPARSPMLRFGHPACAFRPWRERLSRTSWRALRPTRRARPRRSGGRARRRTGPPAAEPAQPPAA